MILTLFLIFDNGGHLFGAGPTPEAARANARAILAEGGIDDDGGVDLDVAVPMIAPAAKLRKIVSNLDDTEGKAILRACGLPEVVSEAPAEATEAPVDGDDTDTDPVVAA